MLKRMLEESENGRRILSLVEQAQREHAAYIETRRRTLLNSLGISSVAELHRIAQKAEERAGITGLINRPEPPTELKGIAERFCEQAQSLLDDHRSPFPSRREILDAARRIEREQAKDMFHRPPELESVAVKTFRPFKLAIEINVVIIPKDKTEDGANPSNTN